MTTHQSDQIGYLIATLMSDVISGEGLSLDSRSFSPHTGAMTDVFADTRLFDDGPSWDDILREIFVSDARVACVILNDGVELIADIRRA